MKRCGKEGWSSEQLTSLVESFRAVQGGTYDATTCVAAQEKRTWPDTHST